jgi:hypothetical protein
VNHGDGAGNNIFELAWGAAGAPSDGPPGVKTIWIGLDKLNTLLEDKEWLPNPGQV